MTVTGWSAGEIDAMPVEDLVDWLEEAGEHARRMNRAREEAIREQSGRHR